MAVAAIMSAFHPNHDTASTMSKPAKSRKRFSLMALLPSRKLNSRPNTALPTVNVDSQQSKQQQASSSSSPPRAHRKQSSLDRHDMCREARSIIDDGDVDHPANTTAPVAAKTTQEVCPIARAILSDAAYQQRLAVMALQDSAQPQPLSKHGVPRLPRGSLTSEKLPLLDHALARVALKRSTSDVEDNGDEDEQHKRHLIVNGRIAAVPILPKDSAKSPFEDDDDDASSNHSSSDGGAGTGSTRATSHGAQHGFRVGKVSLALPRRTFDGDARSLLPRPSTEPTADAAPRRSFGRPSYSHAPPASNRWAKQHSQQQPQRPRNERARTTSPPLSRSFSQRKQQEASAAGRQTSLPTSPSPPTSYRRASMEAKRLSLLALNSLGGHAPQRDYFSEVAQ